MHSSIRFAGWINAIGSAASLVMTAWLYLASDIAAANAVATYGRNVDSGLHELTAANWYFIPVFAILGLAATAQFLNWRWRRQIHWLAWLLVAIPVAWLAASEISRVVV